MTEVEKLVVRKRLRSREDQQRRYGDPLLVDIDSGTWRMEMAYILTTHNRRPWLASHVIWRIAKWRVERAERLLAESPVLG